MKTLIGLFFGIIAIWIVATTKAVDAAVLFLLGGVVPGTDTTLTADTMIAIYGGFVSFVLLAWMIRTLLRIRRLRKVATKIPVVMMTDTPATDVNSVDVNTQATASPAYIPFTSVVTIKPGDNRHQPNSLRVHLPKIVLPEQITKMVASVRRLPVLQPIRMATIRAAGRLGALAGQIVRLSRATASAIKHGIQRVWRTISQAIATFSRKIASTITKHARQIWSASAAYMKPRLSRVWNRLQHEARYSLHGTKVSMRGTASTYKQSSARRYNQSDIKRLYQIIRTRLQASTGKQKTESEPDLE